MSLFFPIRGCPNFIFNDDFEGLKQLNIKGTSVSWQWLKNGKRKDLLVKWTQVLAHFA